MAECFLIRWDGLTPHSSKSQNQAKMSELAFEGQEDVFVKWQGL